MSTTSFVLVPFWVEKVLKRNNLNLSDILDYSKIRKYFSLEDLAGLIFVQDNLSLKPFENLNLNTILLSSWRKTSGVLTSELDSGAIPLSYSKEVSSYVKTMLCGNNETTQDVKDSVYRIVDIERNTFCIVLKEGFIKEEGLAFNLLNFIKDILKVFYVYHKVEDVSKEPIFRTYLELLNGSTPRV